MEEQMNDTNMQRHIQMQPIEIIALKNTLDGGSACLNVLGYVVPGQIGIGFKIVGTVAGIFSSILTTILENKPL